ncbi:unnamed protein product [Paramecium pentaurelia]|uniref:Tetratricopeptide repeat protein n=1 Tax=Paramecium pentaurelia TaxID=43138 RepID=A0A8S1XBP9_9CILI|nr:unnamed protein product [Paramecium pentaurelia]
MTQQSNLKLKCQQDDHKDEIDTVQYNQYCTEFRLNQSIKDHFDDVEKINNLMDFIESKNNECDNLINDLNTFVENMNQSFSKIKIGIRYKYSLQKERLVHLNSLQLNDYLNSTIKLIEYKQSITTIISKQTKKLTHSFNNLYEQLQLSYFNYYEIHDNLKKLSNELYEKGYDLYQGDKYNEAIQILDKSIQQNPINHQSLWYKGACLITYYQLNQIKDGQINMRMLYTQWIKFFPSIHKIHFLFNAKGIVQEINKNIKKLQFILRNHQRLIQMINIQQTKQAYLTYQIRILLEEIQSMNIQQKQLILIDNFLVQKQIWTDNVSPLFQEFHLTFQFNIYTQILIQIQFFFNFLFIVFLPRFQCYKNISKQKKTYFFKVQDNVIFLYYDMAFQLFYYPKHFQTNYGTNIVDILECITLIIRELIFSYYLSQFQLQMILLPTLFFGISKKSIKDHFDDVEKINNLMDFIESKNNECDNLINDLNTFVENMNQSFSKIKIGIRYKYSLQKERLVHLNSLQLNDYLNSTIKLIEYKQSITTIISKQTKKLTHSFNNLYEQLQLSYFNYYEIHDNLKKLSNELYEKGYDLYQGDKYNEAIQILDKSIQQNPINHQSLWCMFNHILLIKSNKRWLNKYEDALYLMDQVLSINPQNTFSLQCKGDCLRDQQKYKEALIYFEKSLKIDPNDQYSINQIGILNLLNQNFARRNSINEYSIETINYIIIYFAYNFLFYKKEWYTNVKIFNDTKIDNINKTQLLFLELISLSQDHNFLLNQCIQD